jgi:hypothetical protein
VRLAAALAVAGVLLCSPGAAAAADAPEGSLGLRLLDVPARPADPRESSYVVATLAPGERLQRRVEVSNGTAEPLEVQLYVAAASTDGPAGFDFADGRTANELSGWTSVRPSTVEVDAGRRAVAVVDVAVPAGAAPGEHVAVVWAEQADSSDGGLTLLSRVGVRMYVEVAAADRAEQRGPVVLVAAGLVLVAAVAAGWSAFAQRRNPPGQGVSDGRTPGQAGD